MMNFLVRRNEHHTVAEIRQLPLFVFNVHVGDQLQIYGFYVNARLLFECAPAHTGKVIAKVFSLQLIEQEASLFRTVRTRQLTSRYQLCETTTRPQQT
jgi:hypothetical protein